MVLAAGLILLVVLPAVLAALPHVPPSPATVRCGQACRGWARRLAAHLRLRPRTGFRPLAPHLATPQHVIRAHILRTLQSVLLAGPVVVGIILSGAWPSTRAACESLRVIGLGGLALGIGGLFALHALRSGWAAWRLCGPLAELGLTGAWRGNFAAPALSDRLREALGASRELTIVCPSGVGPAGFSPANAGPSSPSGRSIPGIPLEPDGAGRIPCLAGGAGLDGYRADPADLALLTMLSHPAHMPGWAPHPLLAGKRIRLAVLPLRNQRVHPERKRSSCAEEALRRLGITPEQHAQALQELAAVVERWERDYGVRVEVRYLEGCPTLRGILLDDVAFVAPWPATTSTWLELRATSGSGPLYQMAREGMLDDWCAGSTESSFAPETPRFLTQNAARGLAVSIGA